VGKKAKQNLTINMGFCASGADGRPMNNFSKANQWFGLDKQLSTLNHNFSKNISISSGSRQTEFYFSA